MSDLFHRMMQISDLIVVAMSPQPKTKPEEHLPPDMAELLLTELDPSQDNSDPTMHLSLLTTKKKALLISMYQYAMMLTCHLTQNNVNIEIFYLCMVDVNFITSIENYYEETPKERDTVVSNSKICAHSLILFFQLYNINILASFFFTSYTLPEIKCKNSSFSNLCLQIIFWGSFFPV
jgi:hypothetical protein